ncbi:MAG: putative envelope protein [uncultured marine phage]|uniref:Putative envelope protein n=1 Tax=uncultured marine phage TaxID=707152 RepID=A0A8D9C9X8_9VIRU|nr:MAG: putative envelope protein [uncultured marine phage]
MPKINEINSFCVHLIRRTDREENMIRELNSFTDNWEVFNAIKRPKGYEGTSASFKEIITRAKRNKLDQVLIFEDDVKFTSKMSKDKFQKAIDSLPDDWDVLVGGVYSLLNMEDLENPYNEHIVKIGDFASLHCILIRSTAYDKILKHDSGSKLGHLDRYIGYLSKTNELNTYLTYPMIAVQYNTYSDNVGMNVDYDRMLGKFEILR